MIEKIRQECSQWLNLRVSSSFFKEHEEEIDIANLHILKSISLVISIFILLTWVSPIFFTHNIASVIVYGVVFVAAAALTVVTKHYCRKEKVGHGTVCRLICLFVLLVGLFTTYIGAVSTPDMLSTWFQIYIICSACMFIIKPVQYMKFALFFEVLFVVLVCWFKTGDVALYDLTNSVVTLFLAVMLQWAITRTRVKELLAKTELKKINEKLNHTNNTDELTGVASRRSIMKTLDEYMICCHEGLFHLGGIIFDVDFFKEYNDTYGHQQGDEALCQAITAVKEFCDANDIKLGRVGGEEFLAVWLCDDISNAYMIAEDIRSAVERQQIFHQSSSVAPFVTISVGAYVAEKGAVISAKEFYARTDKSLYKAKNEGRNRVCIR